MTNPSITLPYASQRHQSFFDTDKLRKKIWGSDTPPGQEDPYGEESVLDRRRREREQEKERSEELQRVPKKKLVDGKDQTEYVPATTIEGLETVGAPGWETKQWVEKTLFQGFMNAERLESRDDIILALHRALVEAYALKEAGLPLVMDYYSEDPTEDYPELVAGGAKFEQDANGEMTLVLESEKLRQSILECVIPKDSQSDNKGMEDPETEEEGEEIMGESIEEGVESREAGERPHQVDDEINSEYERQLEGSDPSLRDGESFDPARSSHLAALTPASDSWRNVSLGDPAIKFAVIRRVMQLTGRRIPDPDISAIATPSSLLVHLARQPKPKKIAEALLGSNRVTQLSNVQILDRRYGPIDRDSEMGRWKLITEELEKRGLPVTHRVGEQ